MKSRPTSKALIVALVASTLGMLGLPAHAYSQQAANLFTTTGNEAIHLDNAGGWSVCAEPTNNTWQMSDVQANTVMLISNGTGSVSQIPISNRTVVIGDRNGNGLQDASFSFSQANLQALFSNFHGHKPHTVLLALTGNLITGGTFSGTITIQVYP